MKTKILFLDEDGDLCFDLAKYAIPNDKCVEIGITCDSEIYVHVPAYEIDNIIEELFKEDRVDLRKYGKVSYEN